GAVKMSWLFSEPMRASTSLHSSGACSWRSSPAPAARRLNSEYASSRRSELGFGGQRHTFLWEDQLIFSRLRRFPASQSVGSNETAVGKDGPARFCQKFDLADEAVAASKTSRASGPMPQ